MSEAGLQSRWIPEREIRFAIVIYGGVSLAIYINGVVQEMLHLVRSTSPLVGKLEGSETIYRKLACLVGDPHGTTPRPNPFEPGKAALSLGHRINNAAINLSSPRSRFVVDILSGTSAGGINAIFLAKALAKGLDLKHLARMWVEDADIEYLLNDQKKNIAPYLTEEPVQSLLNSRWMYEKLLTALQGMSLTKGLGSLVGDLDLYSTTTDLQGLPLQMALTDENVEELRYKNFFHFRRRGAPGESLNESDSRSETDDFTKEMDPFLAFAARCTSSFPVAFQPMLLDDILAVLGNAKFRKDYLLNRTETQPSLTRLGHKFGTVRGASSWERFCQGYPTEDAAIASLQTPFSERPFADGGYLDNKPFSYAIDTIMRRHATVPVDRKLIYIEPAPETFGTKVADATRSGRPNALENVMDAVITLPRYETIRQDLERVIEWNNNIARLRRVIDDVSNYIEDYIGKVPVKSSSQEWRSSPAYRAYERLRLSSAADQVSRRICRALSYEPVSAQGQAIRAIVGVWREVTYVSDEQQKTFLALFDFEYIGRMIRFLRTRLQTAKSDIGFLERLSRITELFQYESDKVPKFVLTSSLNALESWSQYLKFIVDPRFAASIEPRAPLDGLDLSASNVGLNLRVRYLFGITPENVPSQQTITLGSVPFLQITGQIGQQMEVLGLMSKAPTALSALQERAQSSEGAPTETILEHFADGLSALFGELDRSRRDSSPLGAKDHFEMQDSLIFPIIFGTSLGEFETVDIFRISPSDTATICGTQAAGDREGPLMGTKFAAFGGFLDKGWRLNDMLRGRLDGAERLITAVLPDADPETKAVREQLIKEAQEAIATDWDKFCSEMQISFPPIER